MATLAARPDSTGPVASDRRDSIDLLTGIRFFAAAAVVWFHYRADLEAVFPPLRALATWSGAGYLGVDLFFVLSGFILSYNYLPAFTRWDGPAYARFLGYRLARLYPVHLFTLALLVGLVGAAALRGNLPASDGYSLSSLAQNLLLIQAWFSQAHSWNGPAWSISAEWFAYLLFPLAAVAINRVSTAGKAVVGAAVSFAAMLAVFALRGFLPHALLQIGGEFLAGCFLGRAYLLGFRTQVRWDWVVGAALLALLAAIWGLVGLGWSLSLVAPLFGLLILSLALAQGRGVVWLGRPWLLFWGEASYALYMTHEVVHLVGGKLLPLSSFAGGPLPMRLAVTAGYAGVILGSAALTYRGVERPARRLLRTWILPARRPGPQAT